MLFLFAPAAEMVPAVLVAYVVAMLAYIGADCILPFM
jgi:hypothetical protein